MSGGASSLKLLPAILAGLILRRSGTLPARRGPSPASAEAAGYERSDVAVGKVALVMAGLAGIALAAIATVYALAATFQAANLRTLPPTTPQQRARLDPPPPNLQSDPYADLANHRNAERALLEAYAYRGEDRTRARIPLDRARALTVGRSLDP